MTDVTNQECCLQVSLWYQQVNVVQIPPGDSGEGEVIMVVVRVIMGMVVRVIMEVVKVVVQMQW